MSRDIGWTLPLCCHPLEMHDMAAEWALRWRVAKANGIFLGCMAGPFLRAFGVWMMQ